MSPNVGGALPTSSEHYVGQADAPILISSYIFAFRENNVKIKHWVSPGRDSVIFAQRENKPVRSAGPSPNRASTAPHPTLIVTPEL